MHAGGRLARHSAIKEPISLHELVSIGKEQRVVHSGSLVVEVTIASLAQHNCSAQLLAQHSTIEDLWTEDWRAVRSAGLVVEVAAAGGMGGYAASWERCECRTP